MYNPTFKIPNIGVYVIGTPECSRQLTRWHELLNACADLDDRIDPEQEAYLSHFVFGDEMTAHCRQHRSVAGYDGPSWARWLVFDIDRDDLDLAHTDAKKLLTYIGQRYPDVIGELPVYFSGRKGFHLYLPLNIDVRPTLGFHRVARTLAEGIANAASVKIDTGIYDVNRILRLPNSKHPKTGLYKRRIDNDDFFRMSVVQIREHCRCPAGDGIKAYEGSVQGLPDDWDKATEVCAKHTEARRVIRTQSDALARAPKYFVDFIRFGVEEGERHNTLFRCAAWLTEVGCPANAVVAILTEPGRDVGLMPKDVRRQIECGIAHAFKQHEGEPHDL